jgi:uncharacterized membrane protein YozB (DUF420 family)
VFAVLTGPQVILTLKLAVIGATLVFLSSLIALARGNYRLHGRINLVFFTLTLTALLCLEVLVRAIDPGLFDYLYETESRRQALIVHLSFSIPAALVMPAMLYTGLTHRRRIHLVLAAIFGLLWIGTFVTGVFFLPHTAP